MLARGKMLPGQIGICSHSVFYSEDGHRDTRGGNSFDYVSSRCHGFVPSSEINKKDVSISLRLRMPHGMRRQLTGKYTRAKHNVCREHTIRTKACGERLQI